MFTKKINHRKNYRGKRGQKYSEKRSCFKLKLRELKSARKTRVIIIEGYWKIGLGK